MNFKFDQSTIDAMAYAMMQVCTHFCIVCGHPARPVNDKSVCPHCNYQNYFVAKNEGLEAAYRLGGTDAVVAALRVDE